MSSLVLPPELGGPPPLSPGPTGSPRTAARSGLGQLPPADTRLPVQLLAGRVGARGMRAPRKPVQWWGHRCCCAASSPKAGGSSCWRLAGCKVRNPDMALSPGPCGSVSGTSCVCPPWQRDTQEDGGPGQASPWKSLAGSGHRGRGRAALGAQVAASLPAQPEPRPYLYSPQTPESREHSHPLT